jgi:DNA polymerase-3 subunit epsilon
MSVLEGPLVYVDIETNGLSYTSGKIIEVAVIRVENGQIIDSLNYLLNPGRPIPPFITRITGITDIDVERASDFADIADELFDVMHGAVFVAHNVRFDYSFLKNEFKRVGKQFNPKLLCTVKLSRSIYPEFRNHKLQDLIDRCNLSVTNRHRAFDDADAMRQFIEHLQQAFPSEVVDRAVARQIKAPSLPAGLSASIINALPDGPGVYIFEDERGSPLYIGKSVNLKKRVLSHFSSDHSSDGEFKIAQMIANIDTRPTAGELEALLLESSLIKDLQPLYNRQLRRTQKLTIARRGYDARGYANILLEDVSDIDTAELGEILAVYTTRGKAKRLLDELCKTYGLCPRLTGLEKGQGACFSYQLKKCSGACCGKITADQHNDLLLEVFDRTRLKEWPFKSAILVQEMADDENYRSFVIDQWCIIADINQPENCSPTVNFHNSGFDLDAYRIIKSFIETKRQKLNIQPISRAELNEMALQLA